MRIYLMTDLEGVAGILDFENWCSPESRYYDVAKELLTEEVNAAVDGFFAGGATHILVADGHGCGALNPRLLDPRVELQRGWARGWPLGLEEGWDAVAWVGQHAKAGTEFSQLTHTQGWSYIDLSINGISIGEFGQLAMCASQLGVRAVFASGEQALCDEARALVPGIETVAVKRGIQPGKGEDLDAEAYSRFHLGAIHLHPQRACQLIREGAERAIRRAQAEDFGIIPLTPPFERVGIFRGEGGKKTISRESHPDDVAALMGMPFSPEAMAD
ncbi:MAG: M55 family metallopeptidase [Armatimonadetes bacterium]|nr:M55 family metallopeptidase [Armatimonadota bacterium]